jgi:hypothetical protein
MNKLRMAVRHDGGAGECVLEVGAPKQLQHTRGKRTFWVQRTCRLHMCVCACARVCACANARLRPNLVRCLECLRCPTAQPIPGTAPLGEVGWGVLKRDMSRRRRLDSPLIVALVLDCT